MKAEGRHQDWVSARSLVPPFFCLKLLSSANRRNRLGGKGFRYHSPDPRAGSSLTTERHCSARGLAGVPRGTHPAGNRLPRFASRLGDSVPAVNYGAASHHIAKAVEVMRAIEPRTGWEAELRDKALADLMSALIKTRNIHQGKHTRR